MLLLELVNPLDVAELRDLAVNAFMEDRRYRPDDVKDGNPPRLDDIQKHQEWLLLYTYLKCTMNGRLVGSCILKLTDQQGEIIGIHVQQHQMNTGVGSWMINELAQLFPQVSTWTLETPDYATRNHHFYEKNGFTCIQVIPKVLSLGFGFYKYSKSVEVTLK
ncbi:GNAT family N-acetyltransferase [Celerinatantimonas yamalensis]|uniref:GNAT family N-acetyltransferase n=1 Tax=Celerinatantimonas yamalensis TaxID=559956 RepID=A0ABW9G2B4_9GAMM